MIKKRIIIDMTKLSDLNCGLGQVSLNFAKTLHEVSEEFDFRFLTKPGQMNVWGYHVKQITTNILRRYFPAFSPKADVWHAIHQDSAFIPPKGVRFILTIHDLNFLQEKSEKKAQKRLEKLQKKINRADLICYISNFAKKIAESHLDTRNKPHRVIYNGVPEMPNEVSPPKFIPEGKFLFNIGVLMAKKNHKPIIRMMEFLPKYHLVIAGNGNPEYFKELKTLRDQLGLTQRVHFTGFISEPEKRWYYQHAEALAFPSLYEGFGLPIVEAMSEGLPVVCSDKTSLPEIAGELATYWNNFDPEEMAQILIQGLARFKQSKHMQHQLITHAGKYKWSNNVEAYAELYRNNDSIQ